MEIGAHGFHMVNAPRKEDELVITQCLPEEVISAMGSLKTLLFVVNAQVNLQK